MTAAPRTALLAALLAAAASAAPWAQPVPPGSQASAAPVAPDERRLEGHWSMSGRRDTLSTEHGGEAAVARLSGAVTLTTGTGLSRGFRGEFIGFHDGRTAAGRVVWTDQNGDRIFAEYSGGPLRAGSEVTLKITGGDGRYAGISGELTLTWRSAVDAGDGTFHVRTTSLAGRYRLGGPR